MKQQQILQAATQIFMESGYGRVTMEQICKEAKVSKATLYAYYKSKDELFAAVLTNLQQVKQINHPNLPGQLPVSVAELKNQLKDYLAAGFNFYSNPHVVKLYRLLVSEICQFPELFQLLFESPSGRMTVGLANYFSNFATATGHNSNGCYVLACQVLDLLRGASLWAKLTQNPLKQQAFNDEATALKQVYASACLLIDAYFPEN